MKKNLKKIEKKIVKKKFKKKLYEKNDFPLRRVGETGFVTEERRLAIRNDRESRAY